MSCGLVVPVGDGEVGVRADVPVGGIPALEEDPEGSVRVGIAEERELLAEPMFQLTAGQCFPEHQLLVPARCWNIQAHLVGHAVRVGAGEPMRMIPAGVTEQQAAG